MNSKDLIRAAAIVPVVLLTMAAWPRSKHGDQATVVETAGGAIIVDPATATATVAGIDAGRRELTLVMRSGKKIRFEATPDIVNFDLIKIGDRVKALMPEATAISSGPGGAQAPRVSATAVASAPVGEKPGVMVEPKAEVTVKLLSVDAKRHKVTYRLADGSTQTVNAGKKVNLSGLKRGDDVAIQVAGGVLLAVRKPQALLRR